MYYISEQSFVADQLIDASSNWKCCSVAAGRSFGPRITEGETKKMGIEAKTKESVIIFFLHLVRRVILSSIAVM